MFGLIWILTSLMTTRMKVNSKILLTTIKIGETCQHLKDVPGI